MVNGYTILRDFSVVGAGLSKWTFAERGGREFFIKEFLAPTYPDDAAPGSDKTKAKKRARCAVFEAHHRGMQTALAPLSAYGGNLIVTLDFFRAGAKYYKVTEKVDAEELDARSIAALDLRLQLILMKSVAHSLKILHDLRIVHGDLKPSNVLVKRTELGYTSKLIDFDSSYIAGNPPSPEEIVGTINYYSPELLGYIQEAGVRPDQLGVASDVFALGLIFTEFLTGAPPPFDAPTFHEPAVAVRSGVTLTIPRAGRAPRAGRPGRPDARRRPERAADHRPGACHADGVASAGRDPGTGHDVGSARQGSPGDRHQQRAARSPPDADAVVDAAPAGPDGRAEAPDNPTRPGAGRVAAHRAVDRQVAREADRSGTSMSVWRCRVCEGVNQGGRVCGTCGTEVPVGEPLRAAVRNRLPPRPPVAPPPVPPTPTRREYRDIPTPEEMDRIDPDGDFATYNGMNIVPLPGGCLVSFGPKHR